MNNNSIYISSDGVKSFSKHKIEQQFNINYDFTYFILIKTKFCSVLLKYSSVIFLLFSSFAVMLFAIYYKNDTNLNLPILQEFLKES